MLPMALCVVPQTLHVSVVHAQVGPRLGGAGESHTHYGGLWAGRWALRAGLGRAGLEAGGSHQVLPRQGIAYIV